MGVGGFLGDIIFLWSWRVVHRLRNGVSYSDLLRLDSKESSGELYAKFNAIWEAEGETDKKGAVKKNRLLRSLLRLNFVEMLISGVLRMIWSVWLLL
jgi:hypothetical protein